MATLEKVIVKIHPMNEQSEPYVITFEHTAPNFIAHKLAGDIHKLLREQYVAEGAEAIRWPD